jgi:hypothetical protein
VQQPPPAVGAVEHPGLAAASRAFIADRDQETWTRLLAQLLHGYVLLDATETVDALPTGDGPLPAGVTMRFRTVTDPAGRTGLTLFTSQAEIHRALAPERVADAKALIQPLPEALALGFDFVVIDPADPTAGAVVDREVIDQLQRQPVDPGLRAALELGDERRAAVLEILAAEPVEAPLTVAVDPDSLTPDGDLTQARLRTSTSPSGTTVLPVFTSFVEVALRHAADRPVALDVDQVLAMAASDGFDGLVVNPGSSWIVLTGDEVREVISRRAASAGREPGTA